MDEQKINEIKAIQEELDKRTATENKAFELMEKGKYLEAIEILKTI